MNTQNICFAQAILLLAANSMVMLVKGQDATLLNTAIRPDSVLRADSVPRPAGKLLKAVTVTGKKATFEVKADRTVVNVQDAIGFSGLSVLDILQRSPGISVDPQSSSIGMNGKSGVTLMMNGKILRIPMDAAVQLLAGINSASVEKIELITVPPAGYDAEGNAGFINIVMKKDRRFGTNGNITSTLGCSHGWLGSASLDFNHRQEKLNVYGNLSLSDIRSGNDWAFYHATSEDGQLTATNTNSDRTFYIANGTGQLGLDYQAGKKTTIGALVSGYGLANLVGIRSFNAGTYTVGEQTDSTFQFFDHEIHNTYNFNANLNLEHQFRPGVKFTANLDWLHWLDDNPITYTDSAFDAVGKLAYSRPLISHKRTHIDTWVLQADYSQQVNKILDLMAGLKGTLSRFTNRVDVDSLYQSEWMEESALSAVYRLDEGYPAAYVSAKLQVDSNTTLTGGLRYELTASRLMADTGGYQLHRRYGNWFPTITFSRQINAKNAFDISFNRRITRPTFNDMAPWVLFIDPYTYFSGNPGLLPAITNNAGLHYHYRNADLTLSYSYENHSIVDFFPSVDSATHIETLTAINLDYTKTANVVFSMPVRVNSWYSMSWNLNGYWQRVKAPYAGNSLVVDLWSFKIQASQDFKLPKGWNVSLSGYYQSPALLFFYKASGYGSVDLGLRKDLGRAGKLTLNATNLLNTMSGNASVDQPGQNLIAKIYLKPIEYRAVRLTWSRSFGNNELSSRRERTTGSENEQGRVHN